MPIFIKNTLKNTLFNPKNTLFFGLFYPKITLYPGCFDAYTSYVEVNNGQSRKVNHGNGR